jgi:p-hydroxybenzoate 3-monooxygenase
MSQHRDRDNDRFDEQGNTRPAGSNYIVADHSDDGIDHYSERCLRRVWNAVRFSWWFTSLMHRFPDGGEFGQKVQEAEIGYLLHSEAAATVLAENYVGLPLEH